jgi:four helix bundle protein
MKYERFEDLPVWKAAVDLADGVYALTRDRVYALTRDRGFAQPGDLRDQLRRAALSVSNNIAEGFEQGTTSGLLAYLYIARGSAGEVRSMLHFCERLFCKDEDHPSALADRPAAAAHLKSQISDLKSQISDLKSLAESCSRQLRAWADNLQNSDIKGQRHLNDQTRRAYDQERTSSAFWRQLDDQQRRRVEDWTRQSAPSPPNPDASP